MPRIAEQLRTHRAAGRGLDRGGRRPLAIGRVETIDNAIDTATDTIRVKAVFANDDTLFPNQAVAVRLQLDTLRGALAVPQAAVLRGARGFYVYVVGDDSTVACGVVTPGAVDGNWIAVDGALQPGERVVIDGVDRLRDGAKVEVIAADRGGAPVRAAAGAPRRGRGGRCRRGIGGRRRRRCPCRPGAGAGSSGCRRRTRWPPDSQRPARRLPRGPGDRGRAAGRPPWLDRLPPELAERLEA